MRIKERKSTAGGGLTVVCLEGLGFNYMAAVAAHDQVKVVLCRTLAKYGHVCKNEHKHTILSLLNTKKIVIAVYIKNNNQIQQTKTVKNILN